MRTHAMVAQFHQTFGLPIDDRPAVPSTQVAHLRRSLLAEEVNEYLTASWASDIVEVADALADIVYVAYGTALVYGIDLDAVIAEVHRSNMSKMGEDGKPIFRDDGKVMKGPNYSPPDVAGVLGR